MQTHSYFLTFSAGIILHVLVFCRYEWDRRAPALFLYTCLLYFSTFALFANTSERTYTQAFRQTLSLGAVVLSGLYSSILTYRLFLHPLRRFPGPLGARLTSFWLVQQNVPDLKFYTQLRKLHDQHGDFVRIRPRELSICHPDAVVEIHGSKNSIRKAEFYDQNYPFHTLQFNRDTQQHKHERRYWDRAFHNKSLQEYIPHLSKHYATMTEILGRHAASGESIDASQVFLDLFFDVISDLTFAESFHTQTTHQRHPIVRDFLKRQKATGYAMLNTWVLHLVRHIRVTKRQVKDWEGFYGVALKKRSKIQPATPDFYTHLSRSENFDHNGLREVKLAVVAGADTNAITVSNVCYLLCQHAEYQAKLCEEMSCLPTQDGFIDDQYLISKPYLTGIINETLRLHPPVPSGLQRLTPPEGCVIAGQFIPGHMNVTTPTYSLHRDTRAFVRPDEFIPERWTSRPELVLRKDAFVPFGYGPYNCAGKPLAMLQLRAVVATIFRRFEVSFAPGKQAECQHFADDQADCFTLHLEPLPLCLKERSKVG